VNSAAGKTRAGGSFRAEGATFSATVLRGQVTCKTARHFLSDFFHGKGTLHGPPNGPAYKQTWAVDSWKCGYGAGGGACIRHGATYKNARDWIEALAKS
jgi:hypothetical protein